MVAAVDHHEDYLGIEPRDDRLRFRKRPADGEMERAHQQRRRTEREPRAGFVVVPQEILDDQFIHQRIVRLAVEQFADAVLFARGGDRGREVRWSKRVFCETIAIRR